MSPELLEIQPRELKFTFELKKQSSCSVQLVNNFNRYVAFKVKTTSPKTYCVRPNTGVILPKSTCDFTVIMQAQRVAPPDMQLKDKFLIQSTVVPFGSTMEDITSSLFTKESGRYIEENKLRVVLVSPPHSPVLLPNSNNGALNHEPAYGAAILKDQLLTEFENLPPSDIIVKDADKSKSKVSELELKLSEMGLKLSEAQKTITRLREERVTAIQERDTLQQELALLRRRKNVKVQMVQTCCVWDTKGLF
ncbi:vesicle-associated protein 2-2-like isoform X2 [Tasmannia lanceolata]|uniref:vesicle-associated protein 2-2-like isoform X2 n=1 Tax=Tasmannia lanceolata TaxID=3420 RepID=UPI004064193A